MLGLPSDSWALHQAETAFRNLNIQDLDAMLFYYDTDCYDVNQAPFSYPGDHKDMARTLGQPTLLLVGADACTTHIQRWEKVKLAHDSVLELDPFLPTQTLMAQDNFSKSD